MTLDLSYSEYFSVHYMFCLHCIVGSLCCYSVPCMHIPGNSMHLTTVGCMINGEQTGSNIMLFFALLCLLERLKRLIQHTAFIHSHTHSCKHVILCPSAFCLTFTHIHIPVYVLGTARGSVSGAAATEPPTFQLVHKLLYLSQSHPPA